MPTTVNTNPPSTAGPKPRLIKRLQALIWETPPHARSAWSSLGLRWIRTVIVLGHDLAFGQLTLRAMSLVYTTLLSIVPLLALSAYSVSS